MGRLSDNIHFILPLRLSGLRGVEMKKPLEPFSSSSIERRDIAMPAGLMPQFFCRTEFLGLIIDWFQAAHRAGGLAASPAKSTTVYISRKALSFSSRYSRWCFCVRSKPKMKRTRKR